MSDIDIHGLPENAFRELKKGEIYKPLVAATEAVPEVTLRSVFWGIIMTVIFSGSIAYLTLKIGNGIEAAIPIAIIAVGLSFMYKRKSSILENVMIMAVGATSGIVVGGAVFTLPALYIMGLDSHTNLFQLLPKFGNDGAAGNWLGLFMILLLCAYVYWDSRRAKE